MNLKWKKIALYLAFAYGFSWLVALVLWVYGLTLSSLPAILLVGVFYMGGPALATWIVQKRIYREPLSTYGWAFDGRTKSWLWRTPLLFLVLLGFTFAVIALLGNTGLVPAFGYVDFSAQTFAERLAALVANKTGQQVPPSLPEISPVALLVVFILQGVIAGSTVNLPFMFGEELGWRGLLFHETKPMGFWVSNGFIGVVWGLWHLPLILLGHNYPSHPILGIGLMCLFTTALCPLFAYVRYQSGSLLAPCMLHGMINATNAIFMLYVANFGELYSSFAGLAGVMACAVLTGFIFVFDKSFVAAFKN